jgi:hypothetical protein
MPSVFGSAPILTIGIFFAYLKVRVVFLIHDIQKSVKAAIDGEVIFLRRDYFERFNMIVFRVHILILALLFPQCGFLFMSARLCRADQQSLTDTIPQHSPQRRLIGLPTSRY